MHVLESGSEYSWVSALPFVEFDFSSGIYYTIDKSPFQLVYEIIPSDPIDRLYGIYRVDIG